MSIQNIVLLIIYLAIYSFNLISFNRHPAIHNSIQPLMFHEILYQDILAGGSNATWFLEFGNNFVRYPQKLLHILEMEILHSNCKDHIVADLFAQFLTTVSERIKIATFAGITETEIRWNMIKLRMP